MSTIDFKLKSVDKEKARKMVREIVTKAPDNVAFGSHAQQELANDGYSIMDGWNVLKATTAKITRVEPEREGECAIIWRQSSWPSFSNFGPMVKDSLSLPDGPRKEPDEVHNVR